MTATSGKQYAVGLRSAQVIELDTNGDPAVTDMTPYAGVYFEGGRAWEIAAANMRPISHIDNDSVQVTDFLPPTDPATAELRVGIDNQAVNALLTGVSEFTIAESKMMGWMTDKQGFEPDVALMFFQQSKDKTTRKRRWRYDIAPSTICVPNRAPMNENPSETRYQVALNKVQKHLWGVDFTEGVEGFTESALIGGMAEGKPMIVFWKADGVEVDFPYPTISSGHSFDVTALSTDKVAVFNYTDGVAVSAGITKATDKVTFDAAPTADDIIAVFLEY